MKKYSKTEQIERNLRLSEFKSKTLQLLALDYDVYYGGSETYMYWFEHDILGKIVIYPKSDKIQFRSGKWIDGAVDYLMTTIIKEK